MAGVSWKAFYIIDSLVWLGALPMLVFKITAIELRKQGMKIANCQLARSMGK